MLSELTDELVGYVIGISEIEDRYYEVLDLDDMKKKLDLEGAKISVGIAYGGLNPTERSHGARNNCSSSVMMIDIQFHIIVSYWYDVEDSEDTKRKAFGLLDQIRTKVLGQSSVIANRPWEFVSESPLNNDEEGGTIYYIQTWKVRSSQSSL